MGVVMMHGGRSGRESTVISAIVCVSVSYVLNL